MLLQVIELNQHESGESIQGVGDGSHRIAIQSQYQVKTLNPI